MKGIGRDARCEMRDARILAGFDLDASDFRSN